MAVRRSDKRLRTLPDAFLLLDSVRPVADEQHLVRSQSFSGYLTAEQDAVADTLVAFGGVRPLDGWLMQPTQEEDPLQNIRRTHLLSELQRMHDEMAHRFDAAGRRHIHLRAGIDATARPAAWPAR
eukprot:TRINITY_DN12691_c0_g1_i4.p1 TRINITY_DN12691_c0_g1~~TRINITY_DN12691_c0_g1_i4.p1  ORF type:complete len:126 (+),score=21.19 TRINITY_DN12691_c0_g1_i4:84-461(+)